jgi:hypothetical protein
MRGSSGLNILSIKEKFRLSTKPAISLPGMLFSAVTTSDAHCISSRGSRGNCAL